NSLTALQNYLGIGANGSLNPNAPGVAPFTAANFLSSPGYQFALGQGLQAIQNKATTGAGVNSGNTLKALQSYGQGLASQDFYNPANLYRSNQQDTIAALQGIAGMGLQSAGAAGGVALQSGNAQAAGDVAQGKIMGNALTSIFGGGGGSSNSGLI